MATRGTKPKPAAMKLMTGNPGRRPIPEEVGDFTGALVLPAWIEEKSPTYRQDFLAEWNRVTRQLEAWGVAGEVNQGAVEGVATLYANALKAVRADDAVEARQSFDAYRKSLNEFGLTPASKGRVSPSTGQKKASPLAKYTAG